MKLPLQPSAKFTITKEIIEKELGYEIEKFHIEPVYDDNGQYSGVSVCVVPKQRVKFINVSVTLDDRFDKSKLN